MLVFGPLSLRRTQTTHTLPTAMSGIAVGLKKGFIVTKIKAKTIAPSRRKGVRAHRAHSRASMQHGACTVE